MKNNILLITTLAVLALIKFILIPVIEWQNEKINETDLLGKKLSKSQAYIKNIPKLIKERDDLLQRIKLEQNNIEKYNDLGRYKIEKQKQIESLFIEYNTNITSLKWKDEVKVDEGMSVILQLQFSGIVKDFMALKFAILLLSDSISIENFSLNITIQAQDSLGSSSGNMQVVFKPMEDANAAI